MPPTLLVKGSIENIDEIPIQYIINRIKSCMFEYGNMTATLNDRIFIIQAKTGSGKSTVLPVEIFRILRNKDISINTRYRGLKVICTQPRVLTAIELAKDVSSRNDDLVLGITVGYHTKELSDKPKSGLIYATLGILSRQLSIFSDEDIMNTYKFIIIDEAHERTLGSDIVLFMLYHFYKRNVGNKNLPFLILTSATIDTKKYAHYFEIKYDNIINVSGQSYDITINWPKNDISDVYTYTLDTVKTICKNNDPIHQSDILIFLPGAKEINKLASILSTIQNTLVLKLDSRAVESNSQDYVLLFEPRTSNKRYIILSTAVAETGLTISTCKYVIDFGLHRTSEYYPLYNAVGVITKPATKSRITQRKGRVGRLFDGIFYPTYTEETYEMLENQQLPEIFTSSNEYNNIHLLLFRKIDGFNISTINLLDKPAIETFINANSIATLLGYVDHNSKLTRLGELVSKFMFISMEQAKIIFSGFVYNTSILDLVTICALFNINRSNMFLNAKRYKMHSEKNNLHTNFLYCDAYSLEESLPKFITNKSNNFDDTYYRYKLLLCDEFIEALFIFESFTKIISYYKDIQSVEKWCMDNCLQVSTLYSIYYDRENIINELLNNGIDVLYNNEMKLINQESEQFMTSVINIKKCVYEGLKFNILILDEDTGIYKSLKNLQVKVESNILNIKLQNKLKSIGVLYDNIIPKYILTDKFIISLENTQEIMYYINTNFISILDGYIYPDIFIGEPIYE